MLRLKLKNKFRKISRKRIITFLAIFVILSISVISVYRLYATFVDADDYNSSTVGDTTVYVNQLDQDKYYYLGLNYTHISNTSLPTGTNQGLYSESNLVPVTVNYSGVDINDSTLVGKVSPTEAQTQYTYYKYYPVSNGKIEIELPDNLFSLRPLGKGFQGWATTYTGTVLRLDRKTYTRYATIPVSSTDPIEITFNAIWGPAVYKVGAASLISEFNPYLMVRKQDKQIGTQDDIVPGVTYEYEFTPGELYLERHSVTAGRNALTFSGYYNDNGGANYTNTNNHSCPRYTTCNYYLPTEDLNYNPSKTYYYGERVSGNIYHITQLTNAHLSPIIGFQPIADGTNMTGYYFKKDVGTDDTSLYYDRNGISCATSNNSCSNGNTYKLVQPGDDEAIYYGDSVDEFDNVIPGLDPADYYYLVTRDTNIMVLTANTNASALAGLNVPFTVTTSNQSQNSNSTAIPNNVTIAGGYRLIAGNDMTVENVNFNYTVPRGSADNSETIGTGDNGIYANFHNFKLGRNVKNSANALTRITEGFFGGDYDSTAVNSYQTFKVIIESGVFRYFVGGGASAKNYYLYEKVIMGNDYDLANDEDNTKLRFYFCTIAVYRGNLRSENLTQTNVAFTIKSGSYGKTNTGAYDTNYDRGVYVGCRGYADDYGLKSLKMEGGDINVINGGPGNDSSVEGKNVIHISIAGGKVRSVFGGAGRSPAYGNRIIQVTGGTVLNNVFGGSNSSSSDSSGTDGKLYGDTMLYFGGHATIGGGSTLFTASPGDVFGAGNGREGESYRELGTIASTHIIVENDVDIKGNLYGGGNFGTTGRATNANNTTTKIDLLGGTIEGDVFGSSNRNGSGKTEEITQAQPASVYYYQGYNTYSNGNAIPRTYTYNSGWFNSYTYDQYYPDNTRVPNNATCNANNPSWNATDRRCYVGYQQIAPGESLEKYSVCNETPCPYYMARIDGPGFANGRWHLIHENTIRTTAEETHAITINQKGSSVNGNIYGGANTEGTVYADININLESGTIGEAVFGGGRGEETYVSADIDIEVNGFVGSDVSVYGGSAYGGIGYTTEISSYKQDSTAVVNMNSGQVKYIFGGSMGSTADDAEGFIDPLVASIVTVNINGGTVNYVFGGNNMNGTFNNSPTVNLLGGNVTEAYGGSNEVGMDVPTVVNLNGGTATEVFGGSNVSGVTKLNYVNVISGTASKVYGGNNVGGTANNGNVVLTGGTVTEAYGCGKGSGTKCNATRVWINGYSNNATEVYGGGAEASVIGGTSVLIDSGTVGLIYGGTNKTGNVAKSNVYLSGGSATDVFGGNNVSGETDKTYVELGGATVTNVYGGGENAFTRLTNVYTYKGTATNVYGGGHEAGATETKVEVYGATVTNVFGGSNVSGDVAETNVLLKNQGTVAKKATNITYRDRVTYAETSTVNLAEIFTDLTTSDFNGWETNNSRVATVDASIVTIRGVGEATISKTIDNKTYSYIVDVTNTIYYLDNYNNQPVSPGSSSWQTNYPYSNMRVNIALANLNFNQWCDDGGCMGYTYQADVGVSVQNTYTEDVNNYNLLLMGSAPFAAPHTENYLPRVEYSRINDKILKTTGHYQEGVVDPSQTVDGQISLRANTTTNLGTIRVYFNDYNFTINGAFEETIDPGVLNYESLSPTELNPDRYIYTRDMYGIPNYDVVARQITNVYGGNNNGGSSLVTNVEILDGAIVNTVYGGGNEAESGDTNVYLEDGTVQTLFGGGNGSAAIVNDSTSTIITGGVVNSSAYGGGNEALVKKTSEISLIGGTINGSLFAAGNKAPTGLETGDDANKGKSIVNVLAGTVSTNVYGGANTSVVYGETFVNIGDNAVTDNSLKNYDYEHIISIGDPDDPGTAMSPKGTIFGGGEANASGSINYDFNFISVTVGTNVNIDGTDYYGTETSPITGDTINKSINTYGSFFGSGNASETSGYSKININNYGTSTKPASNVSIQRARETKITSSYIQLAGTTDRTNDYGEIAFAFSNTDSVYLLDGTELYLQASGNLLKNLYSGTYVNDSFVKEAVEIDEDGVITSQNVNNKIFILPGKHLDVATNQGVTSFGNVVGMAFMGMYRPNTDGTVSIGMYKESYVTGQTANGADVTVVSGGTYIRGKHYKDDNDVDIHDITEDGYYSHYVDNNNVITIKYVEPIPPDADDYSWAIGINVISFEVTMTASKFSTMGTAELLLNQFHKPNTVFNVTGFSYEGLDDEINLIDKNSIPKVAATEEDADNNFALVMASSDSGWSANSRMAFFTNPDNDKDGDEYYYADNTTTTPSLLFYLYHSKNIATVGDIGSVNISMMATVPTPDLGQEITRISITVNIKRNVIDDVVYDASITAGKKYDIFPMTEVAITNKSAFSAFYTLFAETQPNRSLYENGYYRVLNSDSVFPVGTTITMLDRVENEYYYYTVNATNIVAKEQELVNDRQVSYYLSDFMKMDSTSPGNVYNDAHGNSVYYHDTENYADEEFIFIVDFANANMVDNIIDSNLELEVRAQDDQTMIPIRGYLHNKIKFSAYAGTAAQINTVGEFTDDEVYVGESTTLQLNTQYRAQQYNGTPVSDTVYYDYKLGAKITVYNSDGDMLQGVDLLGVTFKLNAGTEYEKSFFPQIDGTTRITLADKVSTVDSNILIDTANSNLSNGTYTFVIESFGSYDGQYYAENTNPPVTLTLKVMNNLYGLEIESEDIYVTRDKVTGLDEAGNDELVYNITTSSGLEHPNLRVHLERRQYGNGNEYSLNYELVDLQDYVTDSLVQVNAERLEYSVTTDLPSEIEFSIHMGENNITGTYRLVFTICDGDTPIGSVYQYIIIR